VAEMAKLIHVDSLAFISLDGMYRAVADVARNNKAPQFCDACFSGEYPVALTDFDGQSTNTSKQKDLITLVSGLK
jgi:amidophosphoribosyltransferase